jgi:low affinity Fe/Cu permease
MESENIFAFVLYPCSFYGKTLRFVVVAVGMTIGAYCTRLTSQIDTFLVGVAIAGTKSQTIYQFVGSRFFRISDLYLWPLYSNK